MATPAESQAAKSLNNSPGKKKFVFKKLSQRINDIDIKVFRSLDEEPSRMAVKSPGKKKFVFKKFSERINDIDIKVFRRVDEVKAEPAFMEEKNGEIRERLPLEAAKKDDHDHDDAFRVGQAPSGGGE